MKRVVIHPKDRTTDFLAVIYEEWEDVEVFRERLTSKEVNRLFHHCPESTQILLLGHGCPKGLLYREDDTKDEFEVMVGHPHVHYLREHRNTVAIFCHADEFASAERLHGLFSGMIISERQEAEMCDVRATSGEIERENVKLAIRLRWLLEEGCPLNEIPAGMKAMDDVHSELTEFNYNRFFWY